MCVMNGELEVDERRDHRPIGALDDVGRRPCLVCGGAHAGDYLIYACRRADRLRVGLELACSADELLTRREQPHDVVVDSVNSAPNLIEIGFSSHRLNVRSPSR